MAIQDNIEEMLAIARVCMRFGEVGRATLHPDGTPESDTTHTVMLALLVAELAREQGLDVARAVEFAVVHDLAEVYAGDVNTARGLSDDERRQKSQREGVARLMLARDLGTQSWAIRTLHEYERQESPEARLVRYADKVLPKLTHIENGGLALRMIGMTHGEMQEKHARQGHELAEQYPEQTVARAAFETACAACEHRLLTEID